MPARKPLKILQAFNTLKKRRASMPHDQYVKELQSLRAELNVHLEEPRISKEEEASLNFLLKRRTS